jgi:hypothetical protein
MAARIFIDHLLGSGVPRERGASSMPVKSPPVNCRAVISLKLRRCGQKELKVDVRHLPLSISGSMFVDRPSIGASDVRYRY